MSFILEALKKSDKTRQAGTVPKLETVHESVIHPLRKRPKWPWILLLVLILNAAVLLWLFGPWQQQAIQTQAVVATPIRIEAPAEVVKPQPADRLAAAPVEDRSPSPEPLRSAMPLVPPAPVQGAATIKPKLLTTSAKKPQDNPEPDVVKKKIYLLADLPFAISKDLPKLHMSVHSYSPGNPAANLIRINGQIMRTGARLADKYLLEEITSEGAVFLFEGYRFLVPRKNSRDK